MSGLKTILARVRPPIPIVNTFRHPWLILKQLSALLWEMRPRRRR